VRSHKKHELLYHDLPQTWRVWLNLDLMSISSIMYSPISPISYESDSHSLGDSVHSFRSTSDSLLVEDQLEAMLEQERSYQVAFIACVKPQGEDESLPHGEWRRKICEWCYRVVDHFRFDREVVSISMNLFDRFLNLRRSNNPSACRCPSCQRAVDSRTFQLAAMTSLYMAVKLHAESACSASRKKPKLSSIVELSRGQFSASDICQMERDILSTLSWKVNPTTSSSLVSYLLRLMPPHSSIASRFRSNYDLSLHVLNDLARYLSELSVCITNISSSYLPSEIAYASILVGMELLTKDALPSCVREAFRLSVSNMMPSPNTPYLMDRLSTSFWPEMLLNECGDHPMALARDLGLLNLEALKPSISKMHIDRHDSATSVLEVHRHEAIHY
jgi:hypothetical protein